MPAARAPGERVAEGESPASPKAPPPVPAESRRRVWRNAPAFARWSSVEYRQNLRRGVPGGQRSHPARELFRSVQPKASIHRESPVPTGAKVAIAIGKT